MNAWIKRRKKKKLKRKKKSQLSNYDGKREIGRKARSFQSEVLLLKTDQKHFHCSTRAPTIKRVQIKKKNSNKTLPFFALTKFHVGSKRPEVMYRKQLTTDKINDDIPRNQGRRKNKTANTKRTKRIESFEFKRLEEYWLRICWEQAQNSKELRKMAVYWICLLVVFSYFSIGDSVYQEQREATQLKFSCFLQRVTTLFVCTTAKHARDHMAVELWKRISC